MPQEVMMPAAFANLADKVGHVVQTGPYEYHAACPECGDSGHTGGEWADRFMMFTDANPRAFCRRCGFFVWADQLDPNAKPPTKADLDKFREIQAQREEARRRSAELALANLRSSQVWERYYAQLDDHARSYWRGRGIPNSWQDWWQLGWQNESRWGVPTATIPLFDHRRNVLNVKHRLIGITDKSGKYRYEIHGQQAPLFLADPEAPLAGAVVAVEGEVKAMVVKVTLDDSTTIVGLPGTSPGAAVIQQLKQAERVTLVLDPGTDLAEDGKPSVAQRLVTAIGPKLCRLLIPQMKIDDMILMGRLQRDDVNRLLRQAR